MSPEPPIDVTYSGAVLLGYQVTCDGIRRGYPVRVQTHVHTDHLADFNRSKSGDICLTEPTFRLLASEHTDLEYRSNVHRLHLGQPKQMGGAGVVTLASSGHMLGAVQVAVELPGGLRVGYSGDFAWPLDEVIRVDALVVDSTYGAPGRKREYDQGVVETRFIELVNRQLQRGPVRVHAHRGTLQRAMQLLTAHDIGPLLGSPRLTAEAAVYRSLGYAIGPVVTQAEPPFRELLASRRYVRLYGTGDAKPADPAGCSTIILSAYMSNPRDPVLVYSDTAFRVAMSNHADFDGTLEYVRATGATYVVTDNTRGGHGVELALELKARLGINARPSSPGSAWD